MQIIDITIPLTESTPVWEGEKGITIQQSASIGDMSDYNVSRCELGLHSGTHIDAPFHVFRDGKTIDAIPMEKMVGQVQVVEFTENVPVINAQVLRGIDMDPTIKKILLKTKNSNFWGNETVCFHRDYVGIDASAAEYFNAIEMELIGIDWFSISTYNDLLRPHKILLEKQVVLVENLDLRNVKPAVYQLFCLPLKILGVDGSPARVILTSDQ